LQGATGGSNYILNAASPANNFIIGQDGNADIVLRNNNTSGGKLYFYNYSEATAGDRIEFHTKNSSTSLLERLAITGGEDTASVKVNNAALVIDNLSIDGNEITGTSGNIDCDVTSGYFRVLHGGTEYLALSTTQLYLHNGINEIQMDGTAGKIDLNNASASILTLDNEGAGSFTLKMGGDIDFDQNTATEMVFDMGTSFPVSPTPVEGQAFYRTDEDLLYIYDGSGWDSMGGTTLTKIDSTGTWTPGASGWQNYNIQPSSGEVWEISVFAVISANGAATDDLYLQLYDGTYAESIDSDIDNANATVSTINGAIIISNDQYCRLRGNFTNSNEDITWYYQGWKIS
jgi:hypothetical protein